MSKPTKPPKGCLDVIADTYFFEHRIHIQKGRWKSADGRPVWFCRENDETIVRFPTFRAAVAWAQEQVQQIEREKAKAAQQQEPTK